MMTLVSAESREVFPMRRIFISLAVLAPSVSAMAAAPVTGHWYTDGKDSIIEIGQCGATICGKVIKVLKNMPNGKPPIDANNPDPKLRGRPVQGITILSGFQANGKVWSGTIYDPRAGKSYKSTLALLTSGNLQVKGCWGPFCRTVIFTPAK
jgi:uncharacterized protein (DUF2147 family)